VIRIAHEALTRAMGDPTHGDFAALVARVARRELSPHAAARVLLGAVRGA
jgi:hypothetical protein